MSQTDDENNIFLTGRIPVEYATVGHSHPPTQSGLPILGNTVAFATDPFGFVRQAVETTGDIFRMRLLGKDVYVLAHPDYVGSALLDRDTFAKLDDFEVAFGDALLSAEGEQWQRQRHAMESFFSPTHIGEYAERMGAVTASRIDRWDGGQTLHVDEEMRTIALANLFEVVLGHSPSEAELEELAESAHALNLWFKPTSWVLPDGVPTPARRQFHRGREELRDHARRLLGESGATPDDDSLLDTLAALRDDPDSEFDEEEVLDQVVGMVFAGHETTALAMTYSLYLLGSNPSVAERFYAEVDATVDGVPSLADLQDMPYLDRLVDEALRLYPPVHAIPRVTTESVEVGGYTIPEGAQVLLSVWNMHRDSRFYDDPLRFDPDRWETTTPREKGHAYVPFGSGQRICIGRHFARLEMKAVLTAIGRRYRVNAVEEVSVSPQMTSQPAGAVPIRITERD